MNVSELFLKDGRPAGVFFCGQCRNVQKTQHLAEICCRPRQCGCGALLDKGRHICRICEDRTRHERELKRFEAAEKVTEWAGWIFCNECGYQDGYFASVDYLVEWIENGDELSELPPYVWTCSAHPACSLDYHSIIENATDDHPEEWDESRLQGEDELKAAIAAFNEVNQAEVFYTPNYKRALLLNHDND